MSSLLRLVKHTALYGLSSLVVRAINWALTPLYAHHLTIADFGQLTQLYSFSFYLLILLTFGLETAYFHFCGQSDEKESENYGNSSYGVAVLVAFFLVLFLPLSGFLAPALRFGEHPEYLLLMAIIIALDALAALPLARLRFHEQPLRFVSIAASNVFLTLALNLYFILYLEKGLVYILLANVIASTVKLGMAWLGNFPTWKGVQSAGLKQVMGYGLFIMLAGLVGAMNENLDRTLLPYLWPAGKSFQGIRYDGLEMNGIYAAMYKLGVFIALASQAFRFAVEPYYFKKGQMAEGPTKFAVIFHYYTIFTLLAFLFIASLAYEIVSFNAWGLWSSTLLPKSYWVGLGVVPIILLAYVMLSIYQNIAVWYKITARLRFGLYFSLIGGFLTLAINVFGIPIWGFYACAWATLICYTVMAILSYWYGQQYYPVPYRFKRIITYSVLICLAYFTNDFLYRTTTQTYKVSILKMIICLTVAGFILYNERKRGAPKSLKFPKAS
jgi:O-antigen/teichoic acid export membrane protein